MTKSTEELEREVEQTRSRVDHAVDALGEKITPGQLLDELVRGLGGRSGTVSTMRRQIREQPVPLALMGIGLVWVGAGLVWLAMASGNRNRPRAYVEYDDYPDYPADVGVPGSDRYPAAVGPTRDAAGLP